MRDFSRARCGQAVVTDEYSQMAMRFSSFDLIPAPDEEIAVRGIHLHEKPLEVKLPVRLSHVSSWRHDCFGCAREATFATTQSVTTTDPVVFEPQISRSYIPFPAVVVQ